MGPFRRAAENHHQYLGNVIDVVVVVLIVAVAALLKDCKKARSCVDYEI